MKIIAIIQARMGSTRLPGKVLKEIHGQTMLAHVVRRTARAKLLDDIIVATTKEKRDQLVVKEAEALQCKVFCGEEKDVLDRYYHACLAYGGDVIVRITSDCPLVDPDIIDQVIKTYLDKCAYIDYVSNIYPTRTFPKGLDVEVIKFSALEKAYKECSIKDWREHVTPYIYNNNGSKFKIFCLLNKEDYSSMRWTVDTWEDLVFVRKIYQRMGKEFFDWKEVISLLQTYPNLMKINKKISTK